MESQCTLDIGRTLPLVCICCIFSFLTGVGIGGNDLSANFAMVVGSGSLNMRRAIIYCAVFEVLGAAFMGGRVGGTLRNGIVDPVLFEMNRDMVMIGMTCASFSAALWLYLSTVFGLPVSITHTVVGSIVGFAVFSTGGSLAYVQTRGLVVIVASWVLAPVAACVVTAAVYELTRRYLLQLESGSFEATRRALPYCLAFSLLVDFMFLVIEKPPIMTDRLAQFVPLPVQYLVIFVTIFCSCVAANHWLFPLHVAEAWRQQSFVWESDLLRTKAGPAPTKRESDISSETDEPTSGDDEAENDVAEVKSTEVTRLRAPSAQGRRSGSAARTTLGVGTVCSAAEAEASAVPGEAMDDHADAVRHPPSSGTVTALVSVAASKLRGRKREEPLNVSFCGSENSVIRLASLVPSDSKVMQQQSVYVEAVGRRRSTTSRGGRMPEALSNTALAAVDAASDTKVVGVACNEASIALNGDTGRTSGVSCCGGERLPLVPPAVPRTKAAYGTISNVPVPVSDRKTQENLSFIFENLSPVSVASADVFYDEEWGLNRPMAPIRFGGMLVKPYNPRAEYLFTGIQVVAGAMSSFVHGAVAGANATAAFVILYNTFATHDLNQVSIGSGWAVLPAMFGIAIGTYSLGSALMKTVGMELVTVTPARGWCIQVGGTFVTMILTGCGIPVSLSQSQVGAAIGCGLLDTRGRPGGVAWGVVLKIIGGWVVTLFISAVTTGLSMKLVALLYCK